MHEHSLQALARELLEDAGQSDAGRAATTVVGGHEHVMRQRVVALKAGSQLSEHENPGEATVQVLQGRVKLVAGDIVRKGAAGHLIVVPDRRHTLEAEEDSAVLLTTALRR